MPKFRMRHKPAVEGIKIPVSEATFQRLKVVALANIYQVPAASRSPITRAIGYWSESKLRQFRELEWTVPMPARHPGPEPISKVKREVEICEWEYMQSEKFAKEHGRTVHQFIAATILHCLALEEERQRGRQVEPDRFA
jgi:hypothetical protein